jgi:tRNA modification GTPase
MLDTADTIAAVSTPAGSALRGIVRLSGKRALEIVEPLLDPPIRLRSLPAYSRIQATVRLPRWSVGVPVVLYVMRAPRSYTREDIVELHTIGSPMLQQMLLEELTARGARLAGPGEFTRRAFLNGRIDLAQAEAVMAVVRAQTDADLRVAVAQLTGAASRRLSDLRDDLLSLRACVEASIDFSDQGIELISASDIASALTKARAEIASLIGTGERTGSGKGGVATPIVGLPNAGKSSLLNRLAGGQRAIVTHVPGTTRDTVEATIEIDGIAFRLVDTAGIEAAQDAVRCSAVARSRDAMASAQLILFVVDAARGLDDSDRKLWAERPPVPCILVASKIDLPVAAQPDSMALHLGAERHVGVSAATGQGIDRLRAVMAAAVAAGEVDASAQPFAANLRQRDALRRADQRLAAALQLAQGDAGAELIALELREALDRVGELTGELADDHLLDLIFSRFCIGK